MKTDKTPIIVLAGLVGVLLACNQGEDEAKALEDIQTRACACADEACARGVFNDFKTTVSKIKDKRASKENYARVTAATTEATKCFIQKGVKPNEVLEAAGAK